MPSTADSHRSKRPFQPSITSFFARRDYSTGNVVSSPLSAEEERFPVLPAPVQASLLNVGMRVRKSVPEGYKNKQLDEPMLAPSKAVSSFAVQSHNTLTSTNFLRPESLSSTTELLPFCGLHKVGGLSEQFSSRAGAGTNQPVSAIGAMTNNNDIFQFSSQDSLRSDFSTDSMPAQNPNKRRFDAAVEPESDGEDEESYYPTLHNQSQYQINPFASMPPSAALHPTVFSAEFMDATHGNLAGFEFGFEASLAAQHRLFDPSRPLAVPKSRRREGNGPSSIAQGNSSTHRRNQSDAFDFGEAVFLQPDTNEEINDEMEMGDI